MLVLAIDVRNSHYLRGIKGNYQEPRKINFDQLRICWPVTDNDGLIFFLVVTANSDECRAILFNPVIKDKYLLNHIIKSVPVESELGCEIICYENPDCVSYNYGPVLSEIPSCDLNNSTHLQVTSVNFITKNGFSYRGIEVSLTTWAQKRLFFFVKTLLDTTDWLTAEM